MFANIIILSWPLVVIALFRSFTKPVALVVSIIAGYLFLPPIIIDLPGLPALDKNTIPALAAFVVILLMRPRQDELYRPGWLPRGVVPKFLLLMMLASVLLTAITNREPVVLETLVLPGLRPWDAVSMMAAILLTLLPLFLGRRLLAYPNEQRLLLIALVVAGVVFSFLALYEVRMSPQLNRIFYGFVAHSWIASFRGDSFRPVVFFVNGLLLSIFLSTAILATFSLVRISSKALKMVYLWVGLWLLMTLFLTKSLGALAITLLLIPPILFLGRRGQILVAAVLSGIVLLYPLLRGADLVPVDQAMEWAQSVNAERAHSLLFRLANEDVLLERARQKPLFGWGGWGRNHLFTEEGSLSTTTDGYWVGVIGVGGWFRYLPEFGLLCFPAFIALFRRKKYNLGPETTLLLLLLAGNLVDLLPNASLTAISWMVVGSIWGRLELEKNPGNAPVVSPQADGPRRLVYSRFGNTRANSASATIQQRYSRHENQAKPSARNPH